MKRGRTPTRFNSTDLQTFHPARRRPPAHSLRCCECLAQTHAATSLAPAQPILSPSQILDSPSRTHYDPVHLSSSSAVKGKASLFGARPSLFFTGLGRLSWNGAGTLKRFVHSPPHPLAHAPVILDHRTPPWPNYLPKVNQDDNPRFAPHRITTPAHLTSHQTPDTVPTCGRAPALTTSVDTAALA